MAYDFSDPAIVQLIQGHRPVELPATVPAAPAPGDIIQPIALVIVCAVDHENWPCTAAVALRAWQKKQVRQEAAGGGGRLG